MTRRELREHCFKLLFCADFYPTDEMQGQVDVYFTEPKEEDDVPSGIGDIIHNPMLDTFDGGARLRRFWMCFRSLTRQSMGLHRDGLPDVWARWN